MKTSLIDTDSPGWTAALASLRHDFYHLPGYVALDARRQGGHGCALVVEEGGAPRLLMPLILRALPATLAPFEGARDATTPYGYPTPLWGEGVEPAEAVALLRAAAAALVEHGILSTFVRMHPVLDGHLDAFAATGELIEHGPTVAIDLTLPPEELWRQTRRSDRGRINKARRKGIAARMDAGWERLDDFVAIYSATMDGLDASAAYYFGREYFVELAAVVAAQGHTMHLCVVEDAEGVAIAAGLFSEVCGIVQFHLSGTLPERRDDSPSRVMLDFVRLWAKERGNRTFHLGGGLGAQEDSLWEFKRGFSEGRAVFRSWRLWGDPDARADVMERWRLSTGLSAPSPGFFPPYRQGIP